MKKVNLDTWIQLIGMVGLLAGLILVAYELRLIYPYLLGPRLEGSESLLGPLLGPELIDSSIQL